MAPVEAVVHVRQLFVVRVDEVQPLLVGHRPHFALDLPNHVGDAHAAEARKRRTVRNHRHAQRTKQIWAQKPTTTKQYLAVPPQVRAAASLSPPLTPGTAMIEPGHTVENAEARSSMGGRRTAVSTVSRRIPRCVQKVTQGRGLLAVETAVWPYLRVQTSM